MRLFLAWAVAGLSLMASGANAQVIIEEGGQPVGQAQPQQPMGQPIQEPRGQVFVDGDAPPDQGVFVEEEPPPDQRLIRQLSAYLGAPFWLTDRDVLRPGFSIHGRFGYEFGFIVPEIQIGWMISVLDEEDTGAGVEYSNLQNIWATLGARVQFLNRSRMVPFIAAGFRLNFFSKATSGSATATAYTFEPGAMVTVGMAIELTRNFGIEVALSSTVIFGIEVFDKVEAFLHPWAGATLYF